MLGNTSYSLYLLNFPVLMMADLMWPTIDAALTGIPELAKRAIWIVVALIVLVSLSHATFRGIEGPLRRRSEEHTSELQSLMRISYAVFCFKKKKNIEKQRQTNKSHEQQKSTIDI